MPKPRPEQVTAAIPMVDILTGERILPGGKATVGFKVERCLQCQAQYSYSFIGNPADGFAAAARNALVRLNVLYETPEEFAELVDQRNVEGYFYVPGAINPNLNEYFNINPRSAEIGYLWVFHLSDRAYEMALEQFKDFPRT